jgi:hypothetical protein
MQTVQGMGVKKGVKKPGAADITDHHDLCCGQPHILKGPVQGLCDSIVGTSRAKNRRSFIIEQTIH